MDWNHFFHKRDEWKRKAYEEIKQSLISVRENRFVRYDNSKEVHLVMIYGKSQVGKTTLILNMIGLKEEYFDEVYETLRAGISRGNSSTSTAIIYSKSNGEKYGCSHTSANDLLTKIEYFDKDGMRSHLEKIRDKVESNQISADDILKIYIPKHFFIREATVNSISIMDMPGIESRNHKEDTHVKNLMAKYIPISSVCIIACRSNDIQSLETMTLPVKLDWKRMEHRFILVVTHAYNDGTTKRYFKTERSKRNVGFYEYVKDTYTQEIRRVLGDNNRTEVYPVDVGDTLTRLCTDEITNIDDRIEIRDTKDQILSELRSSIISHKGERLKAALKDLEIVIEQFWEDLIKENKDQIKITDNKINTLKNSIIQTRNYKESLKDERKEIITYKQKIERIKKKIIPCKDGYIVDFSNSLMKNIKENGLFKKGREGEYLKDKNQVVLEKIREIIYSGKEIIDYFNLLNNTMKAASIEIDNITQMDFALKFENDCIPYVKNNFYPQKKGLFSKREKIYMNQINDVC